MATQRSSELCQLRAYHAGLLSNYYVMLLIKVHKWSINFPCPFLNEYTHYTAGVCIIFNAFRFWNGSYCPSYKGIAELFAFARALRVYKETFLVQTRCACTCLYCCQKKLLVDLCRGWNGRGVVWRYM